MIKRVIQIGDKRLAAKSKPVKDAAALRALARDLSDTMRATGLVGLAAPQIGVNLRVFVAEACFLPAKGKRGAARDTRDGDVLVFANPKIVRTSKERTPFYEGCGSVAEGALFGPVVRPRALAVEAHDARMRKFRLTCDGLLARVIQHEHDHLDGVTFLERVGDMRKMVDGEHLGTVAKAQDRAARMRVRNVEQL